MRIDDSLGSFFDRPLMCILAAADRDGRPGAGRCIGFRLLPGGTAIEVIFSAWQWPRLAAAIAEGGKLAATFVSPSDYVSFQVKGTASLRETRAADLDRAKDFMARATGELAALGVDPAVIAPWLSEQGARVAVLEIAEIYVQTPGPQAGMRAGADNP